MALNTRKNQTLKIKRHLKAIAAHYKAEFAALRILRQRGETGRLEFEPWRDDA